MHRCFATVIEPLVDVLAPGTIVEVGAGHGRLTARLLRASAADVTVHAIDPRPQAGLLRLGETDSRVHIHALPGVEGLGRIGTTDLVLLDSDPNWSTVRAELDIVVARSREAGLPAPVIVVHNVHWPFGRRDGYHEEHTPAGSLRQPATDAGLDPGRSHPTDAGLRLAPFVALTEGGERNGVLTAVGDFAIEDRAEWELVEIPGFGGTAVLADQARVELDARLRGVLATLRSPDVLQRAGRRAEAGRIEAEVRALAVMTDSGVLRATVSRLESELAAAAARADEAAAELDAARALAIAGSEPQVPEAELAALRSERDRLRSEVRELLEHRAQNAAAHWRIERLEADLSERDRARADVAAERDEQRRLAVDAEVRLEHVQSELHARRHELDHASARLADVQRTGEEQKRRIGELGETERLLSGRVLHLEDSLGAAQTELAEARATAAELHQRVTYARSTERQAAAHVREARSTRRARIAAAARGLLGRSERGPAAELDRALALLDGDERPLPAGVGADGALVPNQPTPR